MKVQCGADNPMYDIVVLLYYMAKLDSCLVLHSV